VCVRACVHRYCLWDAPLPCHTGTNVLFYSYVQPCARGSMHAVAMAPAMAVLTAAAKPALAYRDIGMSLEMRIVAAGVCVCVSVCVCVCVCVVRV
jgi:hypothetical protein